MVLYYNTHCSMFTTNSHQEAFNPYPYTSQTIQQAPLTHYGSGQQGYEVGCPVSEAVFQQGWHAQSVYPVSSINGSLCSRASVQPVSYEDWPQPQCSPTTPGPCTNVGMPVNLSSAPAGQPCNFGLPTYRPHETVTNFQGSVSMADLVQQCSDVGAGISTDGSPSPCSGVGPGLIPSPGSSHSSRPPPTRSPYEWITRPSYQQQGQLIPGRTRTKDKYRTVYTDHQRLELEKEFHYSRYITIRRKTELATMLGLSDRQVKIWFQNRRAKERKQARKKEDVLRKEIDEAQHINSIPAFNIVNKPVSTAINIDSRHYT